MTEPVDERVRRERTRAKSPARELPLELFDQIIEAIADPIFVKDEEHRWIAVNQAFCELMGLPREEFLGKSDFDFFPAEEAKTFWEKDALVFETGGMNVNEEPLTDRDGVTHTLLTKKTVFSDPAGRKVLVGVIQDITERKRVEAELRQARDELSTRVEERTREVEAAQAHLRQAQKMEAVGQLTGGIAHDFNNLLAVVIGNLDLARDRLEPAHPALAEIEGALAAAQRGATLTNRLLAFSRRQVLQPAATSVNTLVVELLALLQRSLGETIDIYTSLTPDLPPTLVDPVHLETAILNLAINARDAMPGGGELTIATRRRLVDQELARRAEIPAGEYVSIEVSDTGTGIPSGVLDRVFEPFFTTKEVGRGSGLGLSMVYGFVKQSNGHVTIQSAMGSGTTISVYLPRCARSSDDERSRAAGTPIEALRRRTETVLIVEDDPHFGKVAVSLVESLGYPVILARSGPEALTALDSGAEVDILLSDVVLPEGMTGPELARRVREGRPAVHVIFMSGYPSDAMGSLGPQERLIAKPFRRPELKEALEQISVGTVAPR
jgi:PAS domain S-box-containing protein